MRRSDRIFRQTFLSLLMGGLFLSYVKGCRRNGDLASLSALDPTVSLTSLPSESLLRGIVIHHSQSPSVWKGVKIDAERLNDIHHETHPDWKIEWEGKTYYIGYHYVILPDGTVQTGRPENCPGAHARTYNHWFGICLIGSFASNHRQFYPGYPTAAQMNSLLILCKDLMLRYHIPAELVKRHQDVNETDCPGNRFPYREMEANLLAFASSQRTVIPLPPPDFKIVKPPHLHSHRSEH